MTSEKPDHCSHVFRYWCEIGKFQVGEDGFTTLFVSRKIRYYLFRLTGEIHNGV